MRCTGLNAAPDHGKVPEQKAWVGGLPAATHRALVCFPYAGVAAGCAPSQGGWVLQRSLCGALTELVKEGIICSVSR